MLLTMIRYRALAFLAAIALAVPCLAQQQIDLTYQVYGLLPLSNVATQASNTVLGNAAAGAASPTALSVGGCSSASSSLIWTTNTGFGCNTSITAAAVPVSGISGLGTGVGTALGVNVGTAGAPVVNGGALGTPSSGAVTNLTGTASININGTVGATTPAAGTFTTITGSGIILDTGTGSYLSMTSRVAGTSNGQILFNNGTGQNFSLAETAFSVFSLGNAAAGGITTPVLSVDTSTSAVLMPGLATSSAATTGTMCWTTGTGNINVDTTTTCLLSSGKYKKMQSPLRAGLTQVMALRPVAYYLKDEFNPTGLGEQVGFFAEDVAKVDARLVSIEEDGSPHAVRYQQMTALLVKAIQELKNEIDVLKKEMKR